MHSAQALLERRGAGVARSGVDAHDVVNAASDAPALAVVFALTRLACRRDDAGRGGAARDVTREGATVATRAGRGDTTAGRGVTLLMRSICLQMRTLTSSLRPAHVRAPP